MILYVGMTSQMDQSPRIIGFYGLSGSGKTTLIECVLRELVAKDLRVAVIKQSSHTAEMDTPDKDTWRFARGGAQSVVFLGEHESFLFLAGRVCLEDLLAMLTAQELYKPDIILVEGARETQIPKVRIGEIEMRPNTIIDYDGDFEKLMVYILKGELQ